MRIWMANAISNYVSTSRAADIACYLQLYSWERNNGYDCSNLTSHNNFIPCGPNSEIFCFINCEKKFHNWSFCSTVIPTRLFYRWPLKIFLLKRNLSLNSQKEEDPKHYLRDSNLNFFKTASKYCAYYFLLETNQLLLAKKHILTNVIFCHHERKKKKCVSRETSLMRL